MNTEHMIDITGVDLVKVAQEVYNLSIPRGLGHFQFQEGPLSQEDAESLIHEDNPKWPLDMDYVRGRSCKFHVTQEDGRLYIPSSWYDHSKEDLRELLERVGIDYAN